MIACFFFLNMIYCNNKINMLIFLLKNFTILLYVIYFPPFCHSSHLSIYLIHKGRDHEESIDLEVLCVNDEGEDIRLPPVRIPLIARLKSAEKLKKNSKDSKSSSMNSNKSINSDKIEKSFPKSEEKSKLGPTKTRQSRLKSATAGSFSTSKSSLSVASEGTNKGTTLEVGKKQSVILRLIRKLWEWLQRLLKGRSN